MPSLSTKLDVLINALVADVLDAVRALPLSELAEAVGAASRLTRRDEAPPPPRRLKTARAKFDDTERVSRLPEDALVTDPEKLLASVAPPPPFTRAVAKPKRPRRTPKPAIVLEPPAPPPPLFVMRRRRSEETGAVHEERVQLTPKQAS